MVSENVTFIQDYLQQYTAAGNTSLVTSELPKL